MSQNCLNLSQKSVKKRGYKTKPRIAEFELEKTGEKRSLKAFLMAKE